MEFLEGESHRPNSIALRANRFSSFIGRENNNVSFDLLFRFDGVSNGNDVLGPTICKYCHFFKLLFRSSFLSYRWFYFSTRVASRRTEKRNPIEIGATCYDYLARTRLWLDYRSKTASV